MSEKVRYGFDVTSAMPKDIQPAHLVVNGIEYWPIVQCKGCKYWSEYMQGLGTCDKLKTDINEHAFCSYGERKE